MGDARCDDTRLRLDLGEEAEVAGHLASCAGCRAEAARIRRLTAWLAVDAELMPPRSLDRAVRALLPGRPGPGALRPWLAGGLAVASFITLVTALAVALAATPAAEFAPLLAIALGIAYLALSTAATLPLLLPVLQHRSRPGEARI